MESLLHAEVVVQSETAELFQGQGVEYGRVFSPGPTSKISFPVLRGKEERNPPAHFFLLQCAAKVIEAPHVFDRLGLKCLGFDAGMVVLFLEGPTSIWILGFKDPDPEGVFFQVAVFPVSRDKKDILFHPIQNR